MRSKFLLFSNMVALAYSLYLIIHFVGGTVGSSGAEAVGGAIATVLVFPHMFMFLVGAVFGWLGFFLKKSWAALVAAILYSAGSLFFLVYFMFGVPILIFGFIGYSKQKKLNLKQ